jgi:hypothetical protein
MNNISGDFSYAFPNTLDNLTPFDDLNYLKLDGSTPMDGDIDMNNHSIKNLANAVNPDEAVNLSQITSTLGNYVSIDTSQTISGDKIFLSNSATRPITLTRTTSTNPLFLRWNTSDNTTRWDIGSNANETNFQIRRISGVVSSPIFIYDSTQSTSYKPLNMNNNKITNLSDGTDANDAVNVSQLSALGTNYVLKTGDTMSGTLNMNGSDITTVRYFDTTGKATFINYISGIGGSWGLNSPETIRIGDAFRTGCIYLRGTTSAVLIQATTANLHMDTYINDNFHGIYNNWYSPDSNSYINSSNGSGCVLLGASVFENDYKVSIERQSKAKALKINGNTDISGNVGIIGHCDISGALRVKNSIDISNGNLTLKNGNIDVAGTINMNDYKILNLATPTNDFDASTKKYVDDKIINDYQANTILVPAGGTNTNVNIQFEKVVNIVHLTIPSLIQYGFNTAGSISLQTNIPAAYRPTTVQWIPIYVLKNSVRECGVINIATTGAVVIYANNASNFGANIILQNGFDGFTVTYRVVNVI